MRTIWFPKQRSGFKLLCCLLGAALAMLVICTGVIDLSEGISRKQLTIETDCESIEYAYYSWSFSSREEASHFNISEDKIPSAPRINGQPVDIPVITQGSFGGWRIVKPWMVIVAVPLGRKGYWTTVLEVDVNDLKRGKKVISCPGNKGSQAWKELPI